jgi:hypothetical protein
MSTANDRPDKNSPTKSRQTTMQPENNSLLDLARHVRRRLREDTPQQFREALEASLLPMIRCALRSGIGHPHVVNWVRRQAEGNPHLSPDPARAAPPMARALCERLLARLDPLPSRETVMGQ